MKKGLAISWMLSVGIAFTLGYSLNSNPAKAIKITQKTHKEFVSVANSLNPSDTSAKTIEHLSTQSKPALSHKKKLTTQKLLSELKLLLKQEDIFFRIESLVSAYQLLDELSESELKYALESLQEDINSPQSTVALSILIGKYARINPEASIDFVSANITNNESNMVAMVTILENWSQNAPDKAFEWFLKASDNNQANLPFIDNIGISILFGGLAKNNLNNAFDKLTELSNLGGNIYRAADGVALSIQTQDQFLALIEKSESFNDPKIKELIINHWTNKNPEQVSQWVDVNDDEQLKAGLKDQILASWSNHDPLAAANWYLDNTNISDKQQSINTVMRSWGYKEPESALDWLKFQSNVDTNSSYKKLLESASYEHTDFAINNLNLLDNDEDKQFISMKIYLALKQQNKNKADSFLAFSDYRDEIEQQLKQKVKKNNCN